MARDERGKRGFKDLLRESEFVRGTVNYVKEDGGFCFVTPDKLPRGYSLAPGKGIFLHRRVNGGRLPTTGAIGEFEIAQDQKGLSVTRVVKWEDPSSISSRAENPRRAESDTFIHPYNFVFVPGDGLGGVATIHPFQREAPATHDRYDPSRFSGWFQCHVETKDWWFLPDARKRVSDGEHKILGYSTLDAVSSWNSEQPGKDTTRPAIPASSLRGMVRSVFEAATLSCFSVFDPSRLDLRVGFEPGSRGRGMVLPGERGAPSYVPARVISRGNGGCAVLQLLDGRRATDPDNTLTVALVHAYHPKVLSAVPPRGKVGNATPLWSSLRVAGGSPVAAVLTLNASPKRKKKRDGTSFIAYQYREAAAVVPADEASSLTIGEGQWLVLGYLHRTGPNIENKHHERIFFKATVPYNDPASRQTVTQRLAAFQSDETSTLTVPNDVLTAADQGLRAYAERHERDLRRSPRPPRPLNENAPHLSDFVGNHRFERGDLCYALIERGLEVRGLYPVSLPRLTHDRTRGELLHRDFHLCGDPQRLCASCRIFGWVRPGEGGLPQELGRVDAVAGHVRFTHGVLEGAWGVQDLRARLATLAILGSPKPTTTPFYLQRRQDYDRQRTQRWPPVLQTALHENIPLYRHSEASLRGRKFYRHRAKLDPNRHETDHGGILRPPGSDGIPIRDSQNQTVHLLPPGLRFAFRVHFDNLTSEELGALTFALTLRSPATWRNTFPSLHAIGHGKPLGLGGCEISLSCLKIDVFNPQDPTHRYAQIPTFDVEAGCTGEEATVVLDRHLEAFGQSTNLAEQTEEYVRQVRESLLEMLRADPPDGVIQYPCLPNKTGDNFEWFVGNRRASASGHNPRGLGLLLPEPVAERDGSDRLARQPTERP